MPSSWFLIAGHLIFDLADGPDGRLARTMALGWLLAGGWFLPLPAPFRVSASCSRLWYIVIERIDRSFGYQESLWPTVYSDAILTLSLKVNVCC